MTSSRAEILSRQTATVKLWRTHAVQSWMLILLNVALLAGNFAGQEQSWQGEAFAMAREVPGSVSTWIITLSIATVIYTVGTVDSQLNKKPKRKHWFLVSGGLACSVWFFLLSYTIMLSKILHIDEVSWNSVVVWIWLGLFWALKAAIDF